MKPLAKPWISSYNKGVPHTISYPRTTLQACLEATAARYPHHAAIIFMGKKITYRGLLDSVNRFAASLQQLGISQGDKVALFLPNSPQFVIAYYGVLKSGATVVPANPLYVERELLHLLKDSDTRTVITLDLKALFDKVFAVKHAAGLKHVIVSGLQEYLPSPQNILFPLLKRKEIASPIGNDVLRMRDLVTAKAPAGYSGPEVGHDHTAVILYTGGTTGVPKGVCLTHDNLVANVLQCLYWVPGIRPGKETFLTVLPIFHAFSMTTSMNLPIYAGGTMVLLPRFEVVRLLESIDKRRPTLFMGVPAVFNSIIQRPDLKRHDLSSIRYCISGGDTLPARVQHEFEQMTGCKLVEGYGLTEASPVVTCNPLLGKRKGIGLPLPDTICKVVDPDTGASVAPGQDGELLIQGPQVMRAYCEAPTETANVLRDGWLYTGDIVRMDEDGYFEFVERKKDVIKVSATDYVTAYKVYPSEVEETLLKHGEVREAAVVGIPDPLQGERVVAHVVLRPGASVTADELIGYCRRELAQYKVPSRIEFVNVLSKNALGKVKRKESRHKALA